MICAGMLTPISLCNPSTCAHASFVTVIFFVTVSSTFLFATSFPFWPLCVRDHGLDTPLIRPFGFLSTVRKVFFDKSLFAAIGRGFVVAWRR